MPTDPLFLKRLETGWALCTQGGDVLFRANGMSWDARTRCLRHALERGALRVL